MTSSRRMEFESHPVSTGEISHDVYLGPVRGPGVLLIHELAGLTENTFELAETITAAGFTVAVPHLFGRVRGEGTGAMASGIAGLLGRCIAREMSVFFREQPRKGTNWLQAAVSWLGENTESPRGVGVIGMCATGSFAMATVVDPAVGVVIGSQAASPAFRPAGWSVPGGDQAIGRSEAAVMVLRFRDDRKSAKARVEQIPVLRGKTPVIRHEGPDDPSLPHCARGIEVWDADRMRVVWASGSGHSVLNFDRVDLAVDEVVSFLTQYLRTP
ncbi:dienelactone hydrolase family protein [Microbacterium sp. B2969]|uniref:Dienelactone hydrolase family protein n=1 Tax=Microbacterium alkaliflavum TaxID=3248839 RepID=A0ABW7QEC4_9MICO